MPPNLSQGETRITCARRHFSVSLQWDSWSLSHEACLSLLPKKRRLDACSSLSSLSLRASLDEDTPVLILQTPRSTKRNVHTFLFLVPLVMIPSHLPALEEPAYLDSSALSVAAYLFSLTQIRASRLRVRSQYPNSFTFHQSTRKRISQTVG